MLKVQLPQQPHKCITYTMSTLKTNQPRPRLSCSHKRGDANSSYAWLTVLDGLSRTSPVTSGGVAHSQTEVLLHPCIWNVEVHWASKEVLNKSSFKSKLLSANSPLAVNQGWHCFVQIMSSHTIPRLPESETSAPYHQLKKGPPIREWLMFPFFSFLSNTSWRDVKVKIVSVWSSVPTHGSATDNPLLLLIWTLGT